MYIILYKLGPADLNAVVEIYCSHFFFVQVIGNQSLVNELCLTARKMRSEEAEKCGLVSRLYEDKEAMMQVI